MIFGVEQAKEILFIGAAIGAFVYETRALKANINEKIEGLKEDIARLEKAQEKSNDVKTRVTISEENIKAIWKRVDDMRSRQQRRQ